MTHLTSVQVLAIALQCSSVDPNLIVHIAQRESGLDPAIVHTNRNGTRDFGLMQINETNFSLSRLTARTAFDPCQSVRAAGDLITILPRYSTGSPTPGMANHYARPVIADMDSVRGSSAPDDQVQRHRMFRGANSPASASCGDNAPCPQLMRFVKQRAICPVSARLCITCRLPRPPPVAC